jgi:hypothetical protein
MKTQNDKTGGPAFPTAPAMAAIHGLPVAPGMTLRQWYKGQALIGIISRTPWGILDDVNVFGGVSGEIADKLLAEDAAFAELAKGAP